MYCLVLDILTPPDDFSDVNERALEDFCVAMNGRMICLNEGAEGQVKKYAVWRFNAQSPRVLVFKSNFSGPVEELEAVTLPVVKLETAFICKKPNLIAVSLFQQKGERFFV